MSEETRNVHYSGHGRVLLFWLGTVGTIIVLGIVGYGVFLVRQYLPVVGYVVLISVGLLPAIAITAAVIWLIKWIIKAEVIEIGQAGTLIRVFGKVTEYHPLGIKEHKSTATRTKTKVEEEIQVPALLDLLKEGVLGGAHLLIGYHKDGSARWGLWDDLRTFAVAGKSRSGKTVTMVFFIVQALLAGAQVWVCDIHHNKKTGLLKVLEPLIPYLTVARKPQDCLKLIEAFSNEMNARESGTSANTFPIVLVIDEWSKFLRDLDSDQTSLAVDTVLNCAEAWAGFEGYAIVGGHEWTARESGGKKGAAVRRGFHAVFVHRLDPEYAKFLLPGSAGRKVSKNAGNTPTGHAHFLDSEGELDYVIIPFYGEKKEALLEVADMLLALNPGPEYQKLDQPDRAFYDRPTQPVNTTVNSKQYTETPVNRLVEPVDTDKLTVYSSAIDSELDTEVYPVNTAGVNASDEVVIELIQRMHKRNIKMRDMAYVVGSYGRKYDQFQVLYARAMEAETQK